MALFFDSRHLPASRAEYVIWLDGMGTGTLLTRSLPGSANAVFKTHVAVHRMVRKLPSVKVYPVMDGLYATTPKRRDASTLLQGVFAQVARQFLSAEDPLHQTIIRAAVAFGPCIHGDEVPPKAFSPDGEAEAIPAARDSIMLSPAMPQAYGCESNAAPFGVAVDVSATTMPVVADPKDRGFGQFTFRWWEGLDRPGLESIFNLRQEVMKHLAWVERNAAALGYPVDASNRHRKRAEDYLPTKEDLEALAIELPAKETADVQQA